MTESLTDFLNLVLIAVLLLLAVGIAWLNLRGNRKVPERQEEDPETLYDAEGLLRHVRDRINTLTRTNLYELGLSGEEFKKRENKRAELKRALHHCAYGFAQDKQYLKAMIQDMLDQHIPDAYLNLAIPFHKPDRMSPTEIFASVLFSYRKEHGTAAFSKLVDRYGLDCLKPMLENGASSAYVITEEEIREIHAVEGYVPDRTDKLEILSQLVYERYKGLGVVDELRDMDIDGLSGGVSGVVENNGPDLRDAGVSSPSGQSGTEPLLRSCDSVWVFFRGKSIRLACLSFGGDKELRRVCQNIYRYNKAGQLSESNGFRVSEMRDGSRVVVVRPPFSEAWAFFVRKFQTKNMSLERLIPDANSELPIPFIRFLAKGQMITAITGSQGCGKTTLLMEMIRHIEASYPLRIQEMAFELHLRRLYPERNILSFRETETVSGQAGLDLQKKTDGAVNILGEVATDEVSAWMIQMAQVASLFTLFTHHAKTTRDLVLSLRNSLLKCEMFNNEAIAEQQVVSVLDFDIHLTRDVGGRRYIERITEIIATASNTAYPDSWRDAADSESSAARFLETTQSFYERMTDRRTFESRNILEFRDGTYVPVHRPSSLHIAEMKSAMRDTDSAHFGEWLERWWPSAVMQVSTGREEEADDDSDIPDSRAV